MRRLPLLAALGVLTAACSPVHDRQVVVTREQFGEEWPLAVNSAEVVCSDADHMALLKLGTKLYALDAVARARGYPDAAEVRRRGASADPAVLRAACDTTAADVAAP